MLVCEGMWYISDFRSIPENVFTAHDDSKAFFGGGGSVFWEVQLFVIYIFQMAR